MGFSGFCPDCGDRNSEHDDASCDKRKYEDEVAALTQKLESAHKEILDLRRLMGHYSTVEVALKAQENMREAYADVVLQVEELQKRQARPCVEPGCDNTAMRCKDHPYTEKQERES